jgi:methyltransferase (TIGR00027 family)
VDDAPQQNGLPSRTSILVAAARAFGSRDPDLGVRNPDFLADIFIGPDELSLIGDHPFRKCMEQNYAEAIQNPAIVMFASLMILRTRFIDEALKRAIENGATQVVILGAGFDSRAYRFRNLLKHCDVIEVDAEHTQAYKRRRVQETLGEVPPNVRYISTDFAAGNLGDALAGGGFRGGVKSFYIWEGVSMYLPEASVREVLRMVASGSAAGSSIALDYATSLGIEMIKQSPQGTGVIPSSWGEPWIFGVPGATGNQYFRQLGFDPGVPLSMNNPEVMRRYAIRNDGTTYAGRVLKKMRAERQARIRAGAVSGEVIAPELQKAVIAAGGVYWLSELTVLSTGRAGEIAD